MKRKEREREGRGKVKELERGGSPDLEDMIRMVYSH